MLSTSKQSKMKAAKKQEKSEQFVTVLDRGYAILFPA